MSNKREFARIWREADAAGKAAVDALNVTPMVVQQRASPLDDSSPVVQEWYVADGLCGFAYICSKGNTAFGRWMTATKGARPHYPTGKSISVHDYRQSYQKKDAYARAFVRSLTENGVDGVWAESRLD